jgi:L-alanine-DL-glutamate epimerase-like enolase superfamily enzyme
MTSRRNFIRTTSVAGAATLSGFYTFGNSVAPRTFKSITITETKSNFEREPLIRPFGFKGGYMTEIWQTASMIKSSSGIAGIGLCTQNVLWSDAAVFSKYSESGGNALMYTMNEYALQILKGRTFSDPVALLDDIWKNVLEYGKKITGNHNLRETFALNALVGVDNAIWTLYAKENGMNTFDEMIPEIWRPAVSQKNQKVASIPLMAYSIPVDEIKQAVENGYFFMKIKIGQPGTQEEMFEKDKARFTEIHKTIGNYRTKHT